MLKGYDAKILADSRAPDGARLTTFLVSIPKFIQAELNTHRMLSRNSASTRAVPAAKMRQRVIDDPVLPVFWGKNQAGMQADEELDGAAAVRSVTAKRKEADAAWARGAKQESDQIHRLAADAHAAAWASPYGKAHDAWLKGRDAAFELARYLAEDLGLHKQIANRVLEPFLFVEVAISATEWDNFWRLRCHPAVQPEFRVVAEKMHALYDANTPEPIGGGEWHLPFMGEVEGEPEINRAANEGPEALERLKKICVARVARLSYLTHDGRRAPEEDLALADRLAASGHWSPFEHIATPIGIDTRTPARWKASKTNRCGNFMGWWQYRADIDPHFQW